jgi:hypothetical protein
MLKTRLEENGPQYMDALDTSLIDGDALDDPEEDKNEAEENGIAGDAPDGLVDIGEDVLDDRESETSSSQAHDPNHAMSKYVEATAAGHPPENEEEHDPPHSPGTSHSLDIIDLNGSDTEDEPKPSTHLERERMMIEMNRRKARVHVTAVEAASRQQNVEIDK